MFIGVLSAHSWTQAQNSPEAQAEETKNRKQGKNKKEKDTFGSQNKSPVRCYLNSQSGFGNRNNPTDKPQHSRQL